MDTTSGMKFSKGYNSMKFVGGVMVLVLGTSSYDALYFMELSPRVSKLRSGYTFDCEIVKGA